MTVLALLLWAGVGAFAQRPAIARDAKLEAKIEKTLAKMTLDEKIGQMLELNLDVMGKTAVENAKVDREKVRSVLQQYGRSSQEIDAMLKMTDQQIIDKLGAYPIDIYQGETKRVWKLNETNARHTDFEMEGGFYPECPRHSCPKCCPMAGVD